MGQKLSLHGTETIICQLKLLITMETKHI